VRATEYAVPTLPSRNLAETLAFYERLGFRNAGDPPDEWSYLIVRRGPIELHFYPDGGTPPRVASYPSGNRVAFGTGPH